MDLSLLTNPFERENEKPLDFLTEDGGYARILRRIACIGDSLASGEFETIDERGIAHFNDIYEQSWGQYLARIIGAEIHNFSRSGMCANTYCESFADERGFWSKRLASQAYIIALGVNDILNQQQEMGTTKDICLEDWHQNKKTFAGYYGQIIQRYQEIEPNAKFFLMTIPRAESSEERETGKRKHAALIYDIAKIFPNCYVLDFNRYAPVFDKRFHELFNLNSHLNPCGYLAIGRMIASYLDFIIRTNRQDFQLIGLV